MHRSFKVMPSIALLCAMAACASVGRGTPAPESAQTSIRVDNQGFPDVNVYAVAGGSPYRLGFIPGNTVKMLRMPSRFLSGATAFQILVRPIAGIAYVLPGLTIVGGEHISVTLTNQPAFSSIAIAPR